MSRVILCAFVFSIFFSCTEEQRIPDRCSKVYVWVDGDDVDFIEYQQYIPRAQDWAYFQTEIHIDNGESHLVYGVNKNIYMSRSEDYIDVKGVVRFKDYLVHCGDAMSVSDTVDLLIDEGKEVLTEYVVQDVSRIEETDGLSIRKSLDGTITRVRDVRGMKQGETMNGPDDTEVVFDELRSSDCLEMRTFRSVVAGDTTQMNFLDKVGPILYTKPDGREIRLEPGAMARLTAEACK